MMRYCIVLGALSCGCFVPHPEHYQLIPAVSGVILMGGEPIEGAIVWVRPNLDACDGEPIDGVASGASGEFTLRGVRSFRLGVVVTGGDRGYSYSLCARRPDGQQLRMQYTGGIGYEAPPNVYAVRCDLAREPPPEICQ